MHGKKSFFIDNGELQNPFQESILYKKVPKLAMNFLLEVHNHIKSEDNFIKCSSLEGQNLFYRISSR